MMVVQKRRDVTQEAQDYLKQFKGARSRNLSRNVNSDDSFEAMLDTWTREKFQLRNGKKAATRSANHRHHSHGDLDHTVPVFLDDLPSDSNPGFWTEGELFAEAELHDEQETYMNEEALLEQLLQQEPPRRGSKKNNKRQPKPDVPLRNKNKRQQPSHSTPKTSAESFHHAANVSEGFPVDNFDVPSVPARASRRGNPPPPPPKDWNDVEAIESTMPSCNNCGWTYSATENEVLDLPELLDILTPKAPRKMGRQQDLMLSIDSEQSPPPLPSKPRPPPPAYHKSRSHVNSSGQNQSHHMDNGNIAQHKAVVHVHSPHSHHAAQFDHHHNVFHNVEPPVLEPTPPLPANETLAPHSPRYHKTHSPRSPTSSSSPRSRTKHLSSRGTQTDPNLLPQDLSPMALFDKEKSSDTDNGKNTKDKVFTRAKPPSGPSVRERYDSFDDSSHLQTTEPVLEAAKRGKLDTMKQLLENDLEQIKMRDIQGNNLMHICCERGHLICVQYLYQHFAYQCEEENKAKFTPAVLTIKGGQADVLDWLLDNTSAKDEILPLPNKKSLLHHAAKFGQDGCLRIVLEKLSGMGRLTSCSDGNGNSPAHVAAKHGHLSCLQILVEYGMDVTKANKYGHSPCYYADFSNHRQCAGYLMVVETCLNLAKKLIRLEKSMEQLSSSLAKYSGDFNQCEINLPYDYGADKSSATSSVEDDGTRDEAWQLLCRKFEEASKRLVVFRTQNRAIRPLKPTKLAMLALAQSKEDAQAAFSVFVGDAKTSSSNSLCNNTHRSNAAGMRFAENRSRSFPDLLSVQSGEEGTPSTEERFGVQEFRGDVIPKHHHSQPDLTTSDDSSHPISTDFNQFHFPQLSLPKALHFTSSGGVPHHGGGENNVPFGGTRQRTVSQSSANENMASSVYRYDNDLEYHLKTRVLPPKSSFRPEKYLIQNWQQQQQTHHQSVNPPSLLPSDQLRWKHRSSRGEIPPPPADNETSDFFEDSNGRHDSDTSELDQETLRKIFDMQEEIMRCHPQGAAAAAEIGRTRIQTPVKLKLTDQEFKEGYERCEGIEKDDDDYFTEEPPILQRYRRVIRSRAPPLDPPVRHVGESHDPPVHHMTVSHDAIDTMNKSCNNSHTDSLDDSLQSGGVHQKDTMHEEPELPPLPQNRKDELDPSKPWYEMTDDEETRINREPEEYFTLL